MAARGVDAIVIMTEWPHFKKLEYDRLANLMEGNLLFDAVNMIDESTLADAPINYYNLGSGKLRS